MKEDRKMSYVKELSLINHEASMALSNECSCKFEMCGEKTMQEMVLKNESMPMMVR
jgi:hypothetical protein